MTIAEMLLTDLAWELPTTRRIIALAPADKYDWNPAGDGHTIGWNANHLMEIAGWTPLILNTTELDLAPAEGPAWTPAALTDPAEVLAKYDEHVAATKAVLAGVSDDKMLHETWSLKMTGYTIFTMNKGECLRKWITSHMSHHRAILITLLRQQGLKIGSIFEE